MSNSSVFIGPIPYIKHSSSIRGGIVYQKQHFDDDINTSTTLNVELCSIMSYVGSFENNGKVWEISDM